jgi:orotidine-5'-phosphate decarboxylase
MRHQWDQRKLLCIGLDSDIRRLPASCAPDKDADQRLMHFNEDIVEATYEFAAAYKLNTAFYEAIGSLGIKALAYTVELIQRRAPGIPVIVDAKRGDIGSTNERYAIALYEELHADAITVNPCSGGETLAPFLSRHEKGVFILSRTSNPGAGEFQDLMIEGRPLYLHVAASVADRWNEGGNCGIVAGATFGSELRQLRTLVGNLPILVPGIGSQGGDLLEVLSAGYVHEHVNLIVNASRSIIFASPGSDYRTAARSAAESIHDQIYSWISKVEPGYKQS